MTGEQSVARRAPSGLANKGPAEGDEHEHGEGEVSYGAERLALTELPEISDAPRDGTLAVDLPSNSGEHQLRSPEVFYGTWDQAGARVSV